MQNLEKLKKEYQNLNEQIQTIGETIKKLEENKNPLTPKKGSYYWSININGNKEKVDYYNDATDKMRLAASNMFLTEQSIDKEIEKRKAIQKIKTYIAMNFPFESDWDDDDQLKYSIVYNTTDGMIKTNYTCQTKAQTQIGFLKEIEDCQTIINKFEKELRIIFDV